jgi:hypothetical protein
MSLIVEDGTKVAGAESYASVADASAYHTARGNAGWAAVVDKEAALRKATDFMLQTYRLGWKGYRVDPEQALDWPRCEVYLNEVLSGQFSSSYCLPSNIVPNEVKNACIELALKVTVEDLNPDLTQQVLSSTVGPISISYSASSPQHKRFRAVDMMLYPYLDGNGITAKVRRS